jgi:uncharacterized membrane protein SpoIIM required for sporulation
MLKIDSFYQSREGDWKKLTQLLERSQRGLQRFSPEEIRLLGALYRSATSDLALAQRDFPNHDVTAYLNQLVARAHAVVYQSRPLETGRLRRFFATDFPRTYRAILPFILASACFFLLPALIAGLATYANPDTSRWILPAQIQDIVEPIEEGELWTDIPVEERPYAASFIATNNIRVAILAFASGVLAGVLTIWIMLTNGLILGGITGLTAHHDIGFELWSFVIGHGVVELSVIIIAGGTGLLLGWSILQPGMLKRSDALVEAAKKAVVLIVGCIPLLLIAGFIEGFISPSPEIPWPVKWGIGLASGLLLHSYLLLAGKEDPETRAASAPSIPSIG